MYCIEDRARKFWINTICCRTGDKFQHEEWDWYTADVLFAV